MARPRTPTATLEMRGSFDKDPQRRRKAEPKPVEGLGDCPFGSADARFLVWNEIESLFPAGVLTRMDRPGFEALVTMMRDFRADPSGFSAAMHGRLQAAFAQFGMTPAARSKIVVPPSDEDETDPFARLN